jgi:hypothetical protein
MYISLFCGNYKIGTINPNPKSIMTNSQACSDELATEMPCALHEEFYVSFLLQY